MTPSASEPLPRPCVDGKRHQWAVNVRKTFGYRGTVEYCRRCRLERLVTASGLTRYARKGSPL